MVVEGSGVMEGHSNQVDEMEISQQVNDCRCNGDYYKLSTVSVFG